MLALFGRGIQATSSGDACEAERVHGLDSRASPVWNAVGQPPCCSITSSTEDAIRLLDGPLVGLKPPQSVET
jgi:hypothetical protein